MAWEPSRKRKKFRDGRGWISVYYTEPSFKGWGASAFKPWSMAVIRNNGSAYLTVFAHTRRELPRLMRLEIAKKQNPALAAVNQRMGGKTGTLGKNLTDPSKLKGFNPPLVVVDELSAIKSADLDRMFDALTSKPRKKKKK